MRFISCIAIASATLSSLACSKVVQEPVVEPSINITVMVRGAEPTRATDITAANESKVGNLQVFVFRDGRLEDYRDAGEATSATLTVTAGLRTVWAVVNAPSLSGVVDQVELERHVSLLSDNRLDSFVMGGSDTRNLTDGGTVAVTVRRLVCRVSVDKVTTGFEYGLAGEDLHLDAIWLVNAAAEARLGTQDAPGTWANKLAHTDPSLDPLLHDRVDAIVKNGAPYGRTHVFYPYPNPTEAYVYSGEWCPRHTMLVLEVTLQGKKGYYPVELPVLERNRRYAIGEIHITHYPGDNPYVPVKTGETAVPVVVRDWENEVNLGTITI